MHQVRILVPGYARWLRSGRMRAGCTITLAKGAPNVLVDTGGPDQRQDLVAALAAEGLAATDINYVVNTHGHLDHIGNNNLFPGATFILDTDIARNGEYWVHDFDHAPFEIRADDEGPSISVIPTPGHTDHDLSVIVPTDQGTVAIVGDLFEHEGDWDDRTWQEWSRQPALQRSHRDRIALLADRIVPGHGSMFLSASYQPPTTLTERG